METQDTKSNTPEPVKPYQDITNPDQTGRVLGGVVIIIIGSLLLARSVGADLPAWLFTWPMIPIAIGLFVGAKHRFRHPGWLIPIAVGAVFLTINMMSEEIDASQFFWPVIIIVIGLVMILKPRGRRGPGRRPGPPPRAPRPPPPAPPRPPPSGGALAPGTAAAPR
ncbi:LiaF transmembrane domain-containing protein, partial [Dawidia soli]|nr:hypothetical protein [Dawidia soli]